MPHEEGHELFDIRRDVTQAELLDDPRLWRGLFEQFFSLPVRGRRTGSENVVANRFEDVRSNFLLKESANVAGLEGFGAFTSGRTFAEELEFLKLNTAIPFGRGAGTGANLASISALSEEDDLRLRQALDASGVSGVGSESVMSRAIRNASIAQFGQRIGSRIAGQETSGQARDRFEIEELQRGREGSSFTRNLLERLRTQFGIGNNFARG